MLDELIRGIVRGIGCYLGIIIFGLVFGGLGDSNGGGSSCSAAVGPVNRHAQDGNKESPS
jgi:hypothetical protein